MNTDLKTSLLLWNRLIRVTQKVTRAGELALAEHSLSPAQFDLLRRIQTKPAQTQQALVDQLEVTRGNISQLLSKLEAAGLLVRVPVGKVNHIELSPAGQAVLHALIPAHDHFIATVFAHLSDAEQHLLLELLQRLER